MSPAPPPPVGESFEPSIDAIRTARTTIASIVRVTPTIPSDPLMEVVGRPVHLKLENLQPTGSFKVRGAANAILAMGDRARAGVITCSSGNHGLAVAYVAHHIGVPATVCVPVWVDPLKLEAIERLGARVEVEGATYDDAEAHSVDLARRTGAEYVHPFDAPSVIAGQGTVGLELLEAVPDLSAIVVPLSGGGLIAGVAVAVKGSGAAIRIVGASATNASVMYQSLRAGAPRVVEEQPTLASALAGGIGVPNRHTFALVDRLVDDHHLVTEEEIAAAIRFAAERLALVVEGGGAVGIAAALAGRLGDEEGPVGIVVSGGNIASSVLAGVLRD